MSEPCSTCGLFPVTDDQIEEERLLTVKQRKRITELESKVRSADKVYGQQSIALNRALDTIEQQRRKLALQDNQ